MSGRPQRVVVVGAGLGGLAAAAHLSARGHDVTVAERGDGPGGKAGRLELDGFTFDTGPTVLTMPEILRSTFAAVGADLDDHLDLEPLDPVYRAHFADGSTIRVRSQRDAMVEEIRTVCGARDADAFVRFSDWLTELYHLEMPTFIDRNYDSLLDLARPLRPALALARLGGFRRLHAKVAHYFDDDRLRRVFSFQSLYAGLAPYQALAIYAVITYMDSVEGVWFPRGGVHEVPRALADALTKAGVEIRYREPVAEIVLEQRDGGPVRGVRLASGATLPAEAVVCNGEPTDAYTALLPHVAPPRRLARVRYSPSAFVWHAGVQGRLGADAAHHNIHFGRQWNDAFRALLRDGRRMPDPSILVTAPTVTDPTLAPPGHSTLFVLEPVPNLDGDIDWRREAPRARDDLARRLDTLGYPTTVAVERIVDPRDWLASGATRGTPFSAAHRFFQSGPFRTANTDARVPGLVFTGAGTVPGVGVPMVLLSGRLAAARVAEPGR